MLSFNRFSTLLENISTALTPLSATLWHDLRAAYQQPHRSYHTEQHIAECLQLFDRYQYLAEQPFAVEFALWFHDAVYQPQRTDNEEQSALLACTILQKVQNSSITARQVYGLIMATAHHRPPQSNDEKLLVDIDLAILAASPARFAQYQQQIRAEYAWVAEEIYQQKRNEVLTHLYNAGKIYHHLEIKNHLELVACYNLQHELNLS